MRHSRTAAFGDTNPQGIERLIRERDSQDEKVSVNDYGQQTGLRREMRALCIHEGLNEVIVGV